MSEATPDGMNYIERVEHYREDVHEELTDTYDYLLAQGCSPRQAAGTLRYLAGQLGHDTPINQIELGDEYDLSGPTIRKWTKEAWQEHTGEEWDGPVESAKPSSKPSGPERAVYHTLYHSEEPLLTTIEVCERTDYSYEIVGIALRTLAKMGAVGGRVKVGAAGGAKEWWAVARNDTPVHEYSTDEAAPTATILREIADLRGWEESGRSYTSDGEYRITKRVSGTSTNIRHAGLEDLTGETDTLSQIRSLVDDYGLDQESDMNLSLTLNKRGLSKILEHEKEVSR